MAVPRIGPEGFWVIWFEDAEMYPETFIGPGAEECAKRRFEQVGIGYNCHLLTTYDSAAVPGAEHQRLVIEHDRRVTELLLANNREVERRRAAEEALRARGAVERAKSLYIGTLERERDRLRLVLLDLARQRTVAENAALEATGEPAGGDYEGAYDDMIGVARAALEPYGPLEEL